MSLTRNWWCIMKDIFMVDGQKCSETFCTAWRYIGMNSALFRTSSHAFQHMPMYFILRRGGCLSAGRSNLCVLSRNGR